MGAPSVPYKISYSPPPRYAASYTGLSATVRYKVDWADAFTFVNQALGIGDGSPWPLPASPNLKATDATINPIGVKDSSTGGGTVPGEFYKHAHIDVTFNSQSIQPYAADTTNEIIPAFQFDQSSPVEMATFQIQYSPQMIKIPGGSIKWATAKANGAAQSVPATVKDPSSSGAEYVRKPAFNLNITLHNCLYVQASNFADKIGKVNSTTMWGTCEPESVLLDGISTNSRSLSNGQAILDVSLNYKWQKIGWNTAMGSDGQIYRYTKQNNDLIYERTDINPATVILPSQRWRPTNI